MKNPFNFFRGPSSSPRRGSSKGSAGALPALPKEWWTLGDTSKTSMKILVPEGVAREH